MSLNSEAELIKLHFENMLVQWGEHTPLRTGPPHASSVLVSDAEWCVRERVLSQLFPEQGVKPELHPWDWRREAIFENGWDLHKRWQRIFRFQGRVVSEMVLTEDGPVREYELDRTHFDETRNIYFSPDAIIEFGGTRYVVEIKGINHDEFVGHEALYKREYTHLTADGWKYIEVQKYQKGVKDCATVEEAMKSSQIVNKAYYQAQLYMHLLGLKKAILLIENKNTQDFRIWVIEHDFEAFKPARERIYDVKRQTDVTKRDGLNKLPVRICKSRGDARAQKCPMRDCCFAERLENWQNLEEQMETEQVKGW